MAIDNRSLTREKNSIQHSLPRIPDAIENTVKNRMSYACKCKNQKHTVQSF